MYFLLNHTWKVYSGWEHKHRPVDQTVSLLKRGLTPQVKDLMKAVLVAQPNIKLGCAASSNALLHGMNK